MWWLELIKALLFLALGYFVGVFLTLLNIKDAFKKTEEDWHLETESKSADWDHGYFKAVENLIEHFYQED